MLKDWTEESIPLEEKELVEDLDELDPEVGDKTKAVVGRVSSMKLRQHGEWILREHRTMRWSQKGWTKQKPEHLKEELTGEVK